MFPSPCFISLFLFSSGLVSYSLFLSPLTSSRILCSHINLVSSLLILSLLFWFFSFLVSSHLITPLLASYFLFLFHFVFLLLILSLLIFPLLFWFCIIFTSLFMSYWLFSFCIFSHLTFFSHFISSLLTSFCILPSLLVSFHLVSSLSYNHVQFRVEYADYKLVESLEKFMSYRKSKSKSAETSTLVLVQNYSVEVVNTQVVQTLACTPYNPHQVRGHMDTDTSPC